MECTRKIADGTETSTFTVGLSTSEAYVWRVFRITDWFGDGGVNGSDPDAEGDDTNPNPSIATVSGGAASDALWFACGTSEGGSPEAEYTVAPASYTNLSTQSTNAGSGGCSMGLARRELNAESENPGAFTQDSSFAWAAMTIAVRPAAAGDNAKTTLDTIRTYQIGEKVRP
jgi:hypothetical protein